MNFPKFLRLLALAAAAALVSPSAFAQIDARMFRQPSVSKDQIAFVYAGDIWLVPKKGGAAVRLTSSPGE
jgi:tricorn protease